LDFSYISDIEKGKAGFWKAGHMLQGIRSSNQDWNLVLGSLEILHRTPFMKYSAS
jgi:hypothetical protein